MYRRNHLAMVIAFAASGHPNNGSTDQLTICGDSSICASLTSGRETASPLGAAGWGQPAPRLVAPSGCCAGGYLP